MVAAFLFGMMVPRAPAAAGVVALIAGPILYGLMQAFATNIHFLLQVLITFVLVCALMGAITAAAPMKEPKTLPVREDLDLQTDPKVKALGAIIIAAVVGFVIVFW